MKTFSDCGTIFVDYRKSLITDEDFKTLKRLALELPREHISVGDTGDLQDLLVARIMVDVKTPTVVNKEQSHTLLSIVGSDSITRFIEKETGYNGKLKIRRCGICLKGAIPTKPASFGI